MVILGSERGVKERRELGQWGAPALEQRACSGDGLLWISPLGAKKRDDDVRGVVGDAKALERFADLLGVGEGGGEGG